MRQHATYFRRLLNLREPGHPLGNLRETAFTLASFLPGSPQQTDSLPESTILKGVV
jgi:hypothetical protein